MRQVEDGARHLADCVRVFADEASQRHLADFGQLGLAEATCLVVVFVPETIATAQAAELVADDTGECGTDQTALQRRLHQATCPQVDVVNRGVHLFQTFNDLRCHLSAQIFKVNGTFQVARSAVFVVRTEAVISSALDVQRGQIESGERDVARLEQVIGHFAGDELVQVLHGSDKHSAQHFVDGLDLHQHLRVEESVAEGNVLLLLKVGVDARVERPHQTVAETVRSRCEFVEDSGVAVGVVTFKVAFGEQVEAVQVDSVPAQDARNVFVVDDVLPDGVGDASAGLVETFIVPVSVDGLKLSDDAVVFAQEGSVQSAQARILSRTDVSGFKAETGRGLTFRLATRLRKKLLAAEGRHSSVESSAGEGAQTACFAWSSAVNVRCVDVGRVLIDLLAGSQTLLAGQGACKGHAQRTSGADVDSREERVVARDGNGPAFRMDALSGVTVAAVEDGVL